MEYNEERTLHPTHYAKVTWNLVVRESRSTLVPIYDLEEYTVKALMEAIDRACLEKYSEIKEDPGEFSLDAIKLSHVIEGYMPADSDGYPDASQEVRVQD
jgi:hypothetical protein